MLPLFSAHGRFCPAPGYGRMKMRAREGSLIRRAREDDAASGAQIEYRTVREVKTGYDDLSIVQSVETSSSKYAGFTLLVNSSGNILSMYKRDSVWTGLYFDEFATLPAVVPEGPIAVLGLGGGTAARILLDVWPSRKLEGWEIDGVLVENARLHLGLAALESPTEEGGCLSVHIGDAVSPEATVDGGFAGIVVDLFYQGEVLPQLQEVEMSGTKAPITTFIVEPFVPHSDEYYQSIVSDRLGASVSFSECGGIEIEENWDKIAQTGTRFLTDVSANAKLLADQEEREIEHLVASVIDNQMKKLYSKVEHFEELEMLLEKERLEVERARQMVYADRLRYAETLTASEKSPFRNPARS